MIMQEFKGKVIWFNNNRGYGFITWNKGNVVQKDLFVHYTDIICEGYKSLKKDQVVKFKLGVNNNNVPKAIEVTTV